MYLFGRHTRTRPSRRPRLEVEAVEGRQLLSTLFVSTTGSFKGLPAFTSIQGAVNAAKPGDTIDVAPGTYHENVLIEKTLTLLGAQAGVNPITGLRTNPANESTVDGSIAVQSTSNVRIDGFSLNDPEGIPLVDFASRRDTLTNNIVLPGAKEGVELLEDKLTTVSNNEIESAVLDGINVSGSKSAPLNDTVQGNEVLNTSLDGINLFDANGVVVKGNLVQGSRSVGLTVSQSTDVNAANNLLVANSGGAIFSESAFDRLQGNTVEFNQTDGIDVEGDHGDVILKNSVFGNATSGLGNAIFLSNVSGGEAVKNNSVLQNHSNGIEVFSTSAQRCKGHRQHRREQRRRRRRPRRHKQHHRRGERPEQQQVRRHPSQRQEPGNTVTENTALGNGVFDAEDLSTGTGTAGTANLWTRNRFNRDNRGGGLGH